MGSSCTTMIFRCISRRIREYLGAPSSRIVRVKLVLNGGRVPPLVWRAERDGAPVFNSTNGDDLVEPADLATLAFGWPGVVLAKLRRIVLPELRDLALWCLQAEPSRRPQSFEDVLLHRFFAPSGPLRHRSIRRMRHTSPRRHWRRPAPFLWQSPAPSTRATRG